MNLRTCIVIILLLNAGWRNSTQADELSYLARNDAVALTISGVRIADRYGPLQPAPDRKFLILATEWRNQLGTTPVDGKLLPTPYVVPELDKQLFLIVNGGRIAPFANTQGRPGVLPIKNFAVPDPSVPVRGNLIFEVLPAVATDLLLVFIDERYGAMSVRLAGEGVAPPANTRTEKNELLEGFISRQRVIADDPTDKNGSAETENIAVNVQLKSIFQPDKKAKCGKLVALPEWQDRYVQVLVDGIYATSPVAGPFDSAVATILPEACIGGEFIFRVPKRRTSLELILYFGEMPTSGGRIRPKPITFALKLDGIPNVQPRRTPVVEARDAVFNVAIVDAVAVDQFAVAKPEVGKKFLVIDAVVTNITQQSEVFQTFEQLKYTGKNGDSTSTDKATLTGPYSPAAQLYIPPGARRAFQLVYAIAVEETQPRIAYTAVTQGVSKVLSLPTLGATTIVKTGSSNTNSPGMPATRDTALASPNKPETPTDIMLKPLGKNGAEPVSAKQNRQPRGLAGVGIAADQVNTAIDKGAKALWEYVRDQDLKSEKFGSRPEHSLVALALVHAEAHKKIPEFDAALRGYLDEVKPRTLGVYRAGLTAMLIEAYADTRYSPKLEETTRYLLEGQGKKGMWTYTPRVPEEIFAKPEESPSVIRVSGGVPLEQAGQPLTRIDVFHEGADGDNSVTQYALLGLNTASRSGIKVSPEAWRTALATSRERQHASGGWGYNESYSSPYGSMTAAGICAMALCRHELGEADPANDPAIEKGLGWLAANFSVSKHPGRENWLYYYLYSIERVGRILDTEFIGPYEWYPLGAAQLLANQKGTGLWMDEHEEKDPRLASSFALLFLTRATPSLKLKPEHGPGTLITSALAPFQNFYIILDASGSMLDEMDGKPKFDIARESVRALVNDLPPNCNVALRVYGHRKRAIEDKSDEDTELKLPMTALDKKKFNAALDSLRPRGKTPLALSIENAVKDLGKVDPTKPVTLLLLTDGGEDTTKPRRDPLKAAALLSGVKGVRFHIVGFDINQPDWSEQLQGIARVSGGRYWPATKAADLTRGVRTAVLGVPEEYVIQDTSGHMVAKSLFGTTSKLPEGKYHFETVYAGQSFSRDFWINSGSLTSVKFDASQVPTAPVVNVAPAATTTAPHPEPVTEIVKRFCTNCGAPLRSQAKFCEKCGAKVNP